MNNQDRESIEELKAIIEKQSDTLNAIHRAIYGDPQNKVLGMIVNQKIMDEKIRELETDMKSTRDFRRKFLYIGSIVIAVVGYGLNKLLDYLLQHI